MTDQTKYWFPAKRYGWGWGPPTVWQGWVVLILWIAAVVSAIGLFGPRHIVAFGITLVALIIVLLLVCYKKGEPPAWRWGERK